MYPTASFQGFFAENSNEEAFDAEQFKATVSKIYKISIEPSNRLYQDIVKTATSKSAAQLNLDSKFVNMEVDVDGMYIGAMKCEVNRL